MHVESWIVLGAFIVYLIFVLVMSFVSAPYKEQLRAGRGFAFNMAWMIIMVVVFGAVLTYNVSCTIDGQCNVYTALITSAVVVLTLAKIGWYMYKHFTHKSTSATVQ